MKKIICAALLAVFSAAVIMADNAVSTAVPFATGRDDAAPAQAGKKKIFMQVGAVEKIENDKYVMRKTETRYEFFLNEDTKLFLRTESSFDGLKEKNYLVIKGPKNKKVVLANSVYIYNNREEYEQSADKKEENPEEISKVFSKVLEGIVAQKSPLILRLSDGAEYTVSYDEDTYWIMTQKADKSEITPGERIKLYFDKLYSIRYKNYPVKIVVDRVKAGF